jgi:hypothetical protein
MSFILDAERKVDCDGAFKRYRDYLQSVKGSFPPGAYALATSDWYFDLTTKGNPHDARLISLTIDDSASLDLVPPSITVRLKSAQEDGVIEFHYSEVFHYAFTYQGDFYGHQDWRYDEFRITDKNHLIHEIEWCGAIKTGKWLIEASDVCYTWIPKD